MKKNKYTFKQIKDYIVLKEGGRKLKFEGLTKEDVGNNIEEFFDSFFVYNKERNTLFVDTDAKQTGKNRRRSVTDIYLLATHYFPRLKLSSVYKQIVRLLLEGKIVSALCQNINCRVYRAANNGEKGFFNSDPIDEYQVDFTIFEGGELLKPSTSLWGYDYKTSVLKFKDI